MWNRALSFVVLMLATLAVVGAPNEVAARKATSHHAVDQASGCATISKAQVIELFDQWNQALQTKRPDNVVARYAADATLLPTIQNGPLIGSEAIE